MFVQTTISTGEKFFYRIGLGETFERVMVRAANEVLAKTRHLHTEQVIVRADGSMVECIATAYKAGYAHKSEPVLSGTPKELRMAHQAWKAGRDAREDYDADCADVHEETPAMNQQSAEAKQVERTTVLVWSAFDRGICMYALPIDARKHDGLVIRERSAQEGHQQLFREFGAELIGVAFEFYRDERFEPAYGGPVSFNPAHAPEYFLFPLTEPEFKNRAVISVSIFDSAKEITDEALSAHREVLSCFAQFFACAYHVDFRIDRRVIHDVSLLRQQHS